MNCPECGAPSRSLNSRLIENDTVRYRRCLCTGCGFRFSTMEVYADIWNSIKPRIQRKAKAVVGRRARNARDREIVRRLHAGEKQAVLALELGMSPGSICTIANRAGYYRQKPKPCT